MLLLHTVFPADTPRQYFSTSGLQSSFEQPKNVIIHIFRENMLAIYFAGNKIQIINFNFFSLETQLKVGWSCNCMQLNIRPETPPVEKLCSKVTLSPPVCHAPGGPAAGDLLQEQDAGRVFEGPDQGPRQGAGHGPGVSKWSCPSSYLAIGPHH